VPPHGDWPWLSQSWVYRSALAARSLLGKSPSDSSGSTHCESSKSVTDRDRVVRRERHLLKLQKESTEKEANTLSVSKSSMLEHQKKSADDLARCERHLASAADLLDRLRKSEDDAIDMRCLDVLKQAASRFVRYVQDLEGDVYTVGWAEASLELQGNMRLLVEDMSKVEDCELALALHPLRRLVGLEGGSGLLVYLFVTLGALWLILGEIFVLLAE
jgi:hypothetical protein